MKAACQALAKSPSPSCCPQTKHSACSTGSHRSGTCCRTAPCVSGSMRPTAGAHALPIVNLLQLNYALPHRRGACQWLLMEGVATQQRPLRRAAPVQVVSCMLVCRRLHASVGSAEHETRKIYRFFLKNLAAPPKLAIVCMAAFSRTACMRR